MGFRNILTKFAAKFTHTDYMKRKFLPLTFLLVGTMLLTSCLGDDTDESKVTYYGDAAITAFSIGTLDRYYLYNNGDTIKKTVNGADSTTTVDCSSYKMTIDQTNPKYDATSSKGLYQIVNADSLPAGTDVRKVVCTVSTKNSGVLTLKRLKKKDTDKDTLDYYVSDSVDFTKPREFRVFSTDGTNYRRYQVRLNVHKEQPDSFAWHRQSIADIVGHVDGTVKGARLLELVNGTDTTMFMSLADGHQTYLYSKPNHWNSAGGWNLLESNRNGIFSSNAYRNMAAFGGWLYLLDGNALYRSHNGADWEPVPTTGLSGAKQLVGAGSHKIYVITENGISASADGINWTEAGLDGEAASLPNIAGNVSVCSLPLKTNKDVERVVMIGNGQNESKYASVWGKLEDSSEAVDSYKWSPYEGDGKMLLPSAKGLVSMVYDGKLYAICGEGLNGSGVQPYAALYCSSDQGLTWQTGKLFTLPGNFSVDADANCIYMASDSHNHVWIISAATGEIWKMRINRLGWKRR